MEFKFECPNCRQHISTRDDLVGKQAACPSCAASFTVPAAPLASSASGLDATHGDVFGMEDAGDLGIAATVGLFRSLDYGFLLPFRKIFSQGLLRKKAVRWVLLIGLTPLCIMALVQWFQLEFSYTFVLIEVYFCLFWALYFHGIIRPGKAIWKRAIGYALFTGFIGSLAELLIQFLPVVRTIFAGTQSEHFIPRFLGFVFGVGIFEECCKAFPLLFFGLRKGRIQGIRDGVFLGYMSGLGFAASEGLGYTINAANAVIASQGTEGSFTAQIVGTVFRLMSGPVFHGALAGTVGWFIGLASTRSAPRWPIIVVGIAFMALMHGTFDTFSNTPFSIPIAAVILLIFMAYLVHGEEQQAKATGVASNDLSGTGV